jgi:hypothetical protein
MTFWTLLDTPEDGKTTRGKSCCIELHCEEIFIISKQYRLSKYSV